MRRLLHYRLILLHYRAVITLPGDYYIIGCNSMFANNAIDTFDALLRKNIDGFKRRISNINNDLIRVMYNCFEIVNGPMWISCANSLYTVKL